MSIRPLKELQEILPHYRALILDLWGVVHDGTALYPGVKETLEKIKAADKKIIFLSNAPRRAQAVVEAMEKMGLGRSAYDEILTSGEACYRDLQQRREEGKYVYIGLEKDRKILAGLPYTETQKASDASFLLCSHSFTDNQPMTEIEPILNDCLAHKLPMLCVNPDMEIVRHSGEQVYCAGKIAGEYARRGGKVTYYGKPHQRVYDTCFGLLPGIAKKEIAAVGDSLTHDISGGNAQGIDTVLVTGGILKERIKTEALEKICAQMGATPTYVMSSFK